MSTYEEDKAEDDLDSVEEDE
jgi:hypothetical protein